MGAQARHIPLVGRWIERGRLPRASDNVAADFNSRWSVDVRHLAPFLPLAAGNRPQQLRQIGRARQQLMARFWYVHDHGKWTLREGHKSRFVEGEFAGAKSMTCTFVSRPHSVHAVSRKAGLRSCHGGPPRTGRELVLRKRRRCR